MVDADSTTEGNDKEQDRWLRWKIADREGMISRDRDVRDECVKQPIAQVGLSYDVHREHTHR